MENRPNTEFKIKVTDQTIERFEELLMELQNIFLEIYSNFSRNDEEE